MNPTLRKILKFVFGYLLFDALLLGYAGLIPGMQMISAQAIMPTTTLSAAITTQSTTLVSLTSVTGVVGTSTVLFIADGNGEAMFVNSVNITAKTVSVTRGYQNIGSAHPHNSGALVFVASGNNMPYAIKAVAPTGSCVRTAQVILPVISVTAPAQGGQTLISDCVGSVWVNGPPIAQNNTMFRWYQPQPGAVAYSSINGTGTVLVAGTFYCNEIDITGPKFVTGLGVLNGSVATTDNHLVALYDATGNLVANSATAGVLAATASVYQNISFTTPYYVVGPGQYFGCLQSNGTTATIRMEVTGTQDQYLTTSFTGVFGTIPAKMTQVPTTFTTAVGPYLVMF